MEELSELHEEESSMSESLQVETVRNIKRLVCLLRPSVLLIIDQNECAQVSERYVVCKIDIFSSKRRVINFLSTRIVLAEVNILSTRDRIHYS